MRSWLRKYETTEVTETYSVFSQACRLDIFPLSLPSPPCLGERDGVRG